MTSRMSDQEYLLRDQYKDVTKLRARVQLHERFSTNKYGWMPWVFDQLDFPPEGLILELGCGAGALWAENIRRVPDGWEVVLSDLSPGMLEDARRTLGAFRRRFEFMVVDIQAVPFRDSSFDGVIANHMLYHVPDIAQALSEVRRVLKPGGRFYAATNGRQHLGELRRLVRGFDSSIAFGLDEYSLSLENGVLQLAEWFEETELRRYEDSLDVTEADPLVAYILSSIGDAQDVLVGERLLELSELIRRELVTHGTIHITKDVGLFEALSGAGSDIPAQSVRAASQDSRGRALAGKIVQEE